MRIPFLAGFLRNSYGILWDSLGFFGIYGIFRLLPGEISMDFLGFFYGFIGDFRLVFGILDGFLMDSLGFLGYLGISWGFSMDSWWISSWIPKGFLGFLGISWAFSMDSLGF